MKILVTGAAGKVGSILRPALEAEHDCRFLDVVVPHGADDRWVQGSLLDRPTLRRALDGIDAVVHLAMGDCYDIVAMYDVNVKGMHLLLEGVVEAGVGKVVYASSMSVYTGDAGEEIDEQTRAPDATTDYGLTKRLSEIVGQAFCQRHPDLSFLALRLYAPVDETEWAALDVEACRTAPNDLRRAFLAALAVRHKGFDGIFIATDPKQQWMRLRKAEWLLGWKPEGR